MNLTTFWVVAGLVFCVMELFLPTGFVEVTLGASAFVVAIASLVIPALGPQVILWLVLSVIFNLALRRFLPKSQPQMLEESREARTLTAIPPGKTGRVIYEGNSWQARCEDAELAIASDEEVYIVRRKGNTLYVLPERLLRLE
jgi:membrane protein implicated in regulation of membrane protease activity